MSVVLSFNELTIIGVITVFRLLLRVIKVLTKTLVHHSKLIRLNNICTKEQLLNKKVHFIGYNPIKSNCLIKKLFFDTNNCLIKKLFFDTNTVLNKLPSSNVQDISINILITRV